MALDVPLSAGLEGYVAGATGALEYGRQRLKARIAELSLDQLRTAPLGYSNSIATLVVHICAAEVRWAYRLTGEEIPAKTRQEFMLDEPISPLPDADRATLRTLTAQLDTSRALLLDALGRLRAADMHRELEWRGAERVTVRWLLAMLPCHQAHHLGQIELLLKALEPPGFM